MTAQAALPVSDNLVPADGRVTEAARLLGPRADGKFIYIRVKGSDLLTMEPQFYGRGLKNAYLYGKQDVPDHDVYYRTDTIERKEFDIRRVAGDVRGTELYTKRQVDFRRALPKKFKSAPPNPPTDWRQVPDRYPKHKFLMKVAQEHPDHLRTIGFTEIQIDEAARVGILSELLPLDENGDNLKNPDGSIVEIAFHVHHCVPLQCGGSNTVENFALVDDLVHLRLFHRGDDPAVRALPEGTRKTVAITVPREGQDIISLFLNVTKVVEKKAS